MDGFPLQHLLRFVDLDTSLCCRSAFHGLKIHCGKWSELDTLLQENDIRGMLKFAYRNGSVKLAKYCLLGGKIDQSEMSLNWGLYHACFDGHKELAELLLLKGASDWNTGLHFACKGGHKDLVELMISKGASDRNWDCSVHAKMDARSWPKLMILKGARLIGMTDCVVRV
jgi:hypothetical protein